MSLFDKTLVLSIDDNLAIIWRLHVKLWSVGNDLKIIRPQCGNIFDDILISSFAFCAVTCACAESYQMSLLLIFFQLNAPITWERNLQVTWSSKEKPNNNCSFSWLVDSIVCLPSFYCNIILELNLHFAVPKSTVSFAYLYVKNAKIPVPVCENAYISP